MPYTYSTVDRGKGDSVIGDLEAWGWNELWEAAARGLGGPAYAEGGLFPARVVEIQRSGPLAVADGTNRPARREGRILLAGAFAEGVALPQDLPAVGDWLLVRELDAGGWLGGEATWLPAALLPRRSFLSRKAAGSRRGDAWSLQPLAANIDKVLILTACGADFSPGRVERLKALAHGSGAEAMVLLSKIDLSPAPEALLSELAAVSGDTPVLGLSAVTGRGMEELRTRLQPGGTVALLGSSGVGKSTLLNALAGSRLADTAPVRAVDDKGLHTTTHRELYLLDSGVIVLDSPGLREVQLWADEADLEAVFPEIAALAGSCKFRDCSHQGEPGCAVLAALGEGRLDGGRYARWKKMLRETAFLDRRLDRTAAAAERAKWKSIGKAGKAMRRDREARGDL